MKLENALKLSANIKKLTEELNSAIYYASQEGISVFVETDNYIEIGKPNAPIIRTTSLVNPCDLE